MESVQIRVQDKHIRIKFTYVLYMRIGAMIKGVPGGRWDKTAKEWYWPATPNIALELYQTFQRVGVFPAHGPDFGELTQKGMAGRAHLQTKSADHPDIPNSLQPAWTHQRQAYYFCEPLKGVLLNMWMGTGKSAVALLLARNREHKRTLIVCPKSVMPEWPKQVARFIGPDWFKVVTLDGPIPGRLKTMQETKGAHILFITNYALFNGAGFDVDSFPPIDFLILDESHNIKSPGTPGKILKDDFGTPILDDNGKPQKTRPTGTTSQNIRKIARLQDPHRLCLSGTPLAHSPLDIWAQADFLDPTVLGDSFYAFRNRYTIPATFHRGIVGYQNVEELERRMAPIMYVADKSVITLPPLVESERFYTMSKKVSDEYWSLYDKFESTLVPEIEYGQKITALLKCQQLCSGFIKHEDQITEVHTDKVKLLLETLEEIGDKPVIIFCRFQHEITMIKKAIGTCGEISGRQSDLLPFQNGEVDRLVVQVQAGSVGIDLTRADTAIYYSLDWSLSNYDQSQARVHRPGQTQTTHLIYLLSERIDGKATIDSDIRNALSARQDFIHQIFSAKNQDIF